MLCQGAEHVGNVKAILKQLQSTEDVQPEAGAGHGHDQTPDISNVADMSRAHERQQYVVVLLALKAIHRGDVCRCAQPWIWCTPGGHDVSEQVFLAVVCGQHGDALSRVAKDTHVHERCHHVLCLAKVLEEVGGRYTLSYPVEISDFHELVRAGKSCVGCGVSRPAADTWEILQAAVLPVEQGRHVRPGTALRVESGRRHLQAHKAREHALLQATPLTKCHALHDRGQLLVVPDEHHPLETVRFAHVLALADEGQKRLHLQHLRCLLHDHAVVLETEVDEAPASQRCVRASHGNDARLLRQHEVSAQALRAQQLEGPVVRHLVKHSTQVPEAAAGSAHGCSKALAFWEEALKPAWR